MYGGSQGGPAGATPNTSGGATEGGRDGDDIDKVTTSSDKVQSVWERWPPWDAICASGVGLHVALAVLAVMQRE